MTPEDEAVFFRTVAAGRVRGSSTEYLALFYAAATFALRGVVDGSPQVYAVDSTDRYTPMGWDGTLRDYIEVFSRMPRDVVASLVEMIGTELTARGMRIELGEEQKP